MRSNQGSVSFIYAGHLDGCVSGHLPEEVFWVIKASFTANSYYIGSKYCSEKKKFLDLKQGREVHAFKGGFQTRKMRSIYIQD